VSQDPETIRQDIEKTQARMGETVEALTYNADLPSRARDAVKGKAAEVVASASGIVGAAGDAIGDITSTARAKAADAAAAMPSGSQVIQTLRTVAADNPLGLAIGSVAIGFLIGLCLPVSDIERDRVGRIGEEMTEQARSAAADAIEQGKAAVTQAIGDAISGTTQTPA
jgi:Protein of unknown function (DUF3618)